MDEKVYDKIYQGLINILNKNHLPWVVDQVVEEIHLGILEDQPVNIKTFEEIPPRSKKNASDHPVLKQSRRSADFLTIRQYTSKERVLLLLDAMKRITADRTLMANEIFNLLSSPDQQIDEIKFIDERTNETFVVRRQEVSSRLEGVKELAEVLEQLRKEIENGN